MFSYDETATEAPPSSGAVKVRQENDSLWDISFQLPSVDAADKEILARFRQAKRDVSIKYKVPIELLELREILEKTPTPDGLSVRISMGKIEDAQGKPVVRLKPMKTRRGGVFQDMIAEIDFFYRDEFDQVINLDRIKIELKKAGVDLEMCDFAALDKKLKVVLKKRNYVKGFIAAKGELPDEGKDAQLEYTFFTNRSANIDLGDYNESRQVKFGDILCQKILPVDGVNEGVNVSGETIPPIKGLDLELVAGEGVKRSVDQLKLTAAMDGMATMTRTHRRVYTVAGSRIVPEIIKVSVKPLIQVNAEDLGDDVILDDSIQIKGTIKEGTTITSRGEILLDGDVGKGVTIRAGEDVSIRGEIKGSEITSDNSIAGNSDASDVSISAGNDVEVNGVVVNSEISGQRVALREAKGSNIVASKKVSLKHVGEHTTGSRTTIKIGRKDFYKKKIEANQRAIAGATASYEKICNIFGPKMIAKLRESNIQQILLQHINMQKHEGNSRLDKDRIKSLKILLNSIPALKDIIAEKTAELNILQSKADDDSIKKPIVVIKESIQDPVDIEINDHMLKLKPSQKGVAVAVSDNNEIDTHKLKKSSKKRG